MSINYDYYKVEFKLVREMLGTNSEVSIMEEHKTKVAIKAIKKANKESTKLTKALEKYYGAEISDEKHIAEVKQTISTFSELTGKFIDNLPSELDELLEIAKELEAEYQRLIKQGTLQRATVFMRMRKEDAPNKTWPIISTHMVIGNLKSIASIITNASLDEPQKKGKEEKATKKDLINNQGKWKSKTAVQEALALDVKPMQYFMIPSNDIRRWGDDSPDMVDLPEDVVEIREPGSNRRLMERPLIFEKNGHKESTISISERLPIGTTFGCTIRVRKYSAMTQEILEKYLDYGKNLGFGKWRSVGNMGAYKYKLEKLPDIDETDSDGFK